MDKVSWVENKAFNDAVLVNADLVERPIYNSKERNYARNEVHGTSLALQGNVSGADLVSIIKARRE